MFNDALIQIPLQLHRTTLDVHRLSTYLFDNHLCILVNKHMIVADQRDMNASFPLLLMV